MGDKIKLEEFMLMMEQELGTKYHVSDTAISIAVLSAQVCRIHDDLRKIGNVLVSLTANNGEEAFIRVCGSVDTYEQN